MSCGLSRRATGRGRGAGTPAVVGRFSRGTDAFRSIRPYNPYKHAHTMRVRSAPVYSTVFARTTCISFVSEKPIFAPTPLSFGPKHWTNHRAIIIIQTQRPGTVSFQVARPCACVCVSRLHSFSPMRTGTNTQRIIMYTRTLLYPMCGEDHPLLA